MVLVGEGAGETEARQRHRTPRLKPWKIHLLFPHATLHRARWLFACVHLCFTHLPSPVFSPLFFFFPFLLGRNDVAEET
jgi:hypothetical protein